jgi:recombination associated protein RdgC
MLFRNLSLFRFPVSVARRLAGLEDALETHRLRACGPLEMATHGFVSPLGREAEALCLRLDRHILVALGSEERLLPGAVVREALAQKLAERAAAEGRRIGARERSRLKETVISELMPRAFVRPTRLFAYLDTREGWLVVDTSSRKAAELVVGELRTALGRFPATPVAATQAPRSLMTDWLIHGKLPPDLTLGDECELRDPAESGAIARCRRQDLESDEVRGHLRSGKQAFQLGLTFADRIEFVLGEDLVVHKLRFLDVVHDELDADAAESAEAELTQRFALMTLEQEQLLAAMGRWFGLPRPGDRD